MRIEREGKVQPLTPRVFSFLKGALGGKSLDSAGDAFSRPDFSCLRGLLVVEVKTLEGAPQERLDRAMAERAQAGDWPAFLGTWPISSVIKHLPDAPEFLEKLTERLARSIVTHLKKGDKQLGNHKAMNPRNRVVGLLILVNDDHVEYDPDVVGTILARERERTKGGLPRYSHIDAVVYLSERHASNIRNQITFPVVVAEGRTASSQDVWKLDVIYFVSQRWAAWLGRPFQGVTDQSDVKFVEVEPIPATMRRHEQWSLEYRRRRYMETWSDERLRDEWDTVAVANVVALHKNPPIQLPKSAAEALLIRFTHLRDEAAIRGLPLAYFKPSGTRIRSAVERLPFGDAVARWIVGELAHLKDE